MNRRYSSRGLGMICDLGAKSKALPPNRISTSYSPYLLHCHSVYVVQFLYDQKGGILSGRNQNKTQLSQQLQKNHAIFTYIHQALLCCDCEPAAQYRTTRAEAARQFEKKRYYFKKYLFVLCCNQRSLDLLPHTVSNQFGLEAWREPLRSILIKRI